MESEEELKSKAKALRAKIEDAKQKFSEEFRLLANIKYIKKYKIGEATYSLNFADAVGRMNSAVSRINKIVDINSTLTQAQNTYNEELKAYELIFQALERLKYFNSYQQRKAEAYKRVDVTGSQTLLAYYNDNFQNQVNLYFLLKFSDEEFNFYKENQEKDLGVINEVLSLIDSFDEKVKNKSIGDENIEDKCTEFSQILKKQVSWDELSKNEITETLDYYKSELQKIEEKIKNYEEALQNSLNKVKEFGGTLNDLSAVIKLIGSEVQYNITPLKVGNTLKQKIDLNNKYITDNQGTLNAMQAEVDEFVKNETQGLLNDSSGIPALSKKLEELNVKSFVVEKINFLQEIKANLEKYKKRVASYASQVNAIHNMKIKIIFDEKNPKLINLLFEQPSLNTLLKDTNIPEGFLLCIHDMVFWEPKATSNDWQAILDAYNAYEKDDKWALDAEKLYSKIYEYESINNKLDSEVFKKFKQSICLDIFSSSSLEAKKHNIESQAETHFVHKNQFWDYLNKIIALLSGNSKESSVKKNPTHLFRTRTQQQLKNMVESFENETNNNNFNPHGGG